jgi:hypothetical protein
VKSRWTILLAACAAALLLAAAGCGGSSDDDSSSSTESTTTTTTSTSGSGGSARLSQASWDAYEQELAQAQSVNQKAVKTFSKCEQVIQSKQNQQAIQKCFGNSTSSVVTEGQQFLQDIQKAQSEASGACAQAAGELYTQVRFYVSSVNALNLSIQSSTSPTAQSVEAAKSSLAKARAASTPFEQACKPA